MASSNKQAGNIFENDFALILAQEGFWAHVMQQNKAGQPSDIIAVKGKFHTLIDCKDISDPRKGFPFSRIEWNQRLAMDAFTKKCGEPCFFALKFPDGEIRILGYGRVKVLESRGQKSITPKMMAYETWLFDDWLASVNAWANHERKEETADKAEDE